MASMQDTYNKNFLMFLCAWCDSSSQHVFPDPDDGT